MTRFIVPRLGRSKKAGGVYPVEYERVLHRVKGRDGELRIAEFGIKETAVS